MAKVPEALVKRQVRGMLEEFGAWFFMPFMMGVGNAGVPDFMGIHKGRGFGIECKAGKNKPTKLQERELGRIVQAGGFALVVNETEGLSTLYEWLLNG